MRKLLISALFVFLFIISVKAQKDTAFASVRYTFTHLEDTTWPENPSKLNMILLLGKNMSRYTLFDRFERVRNNPATAFGAMSPTMAAEIAVVEDYIKDITNGKLSYMAYPNGKLFAVEENIPVINWNITQETKEIMGLACQKATAEFRGRVYDAWFCSQLPYNNGPWKLGGLPGLIIEAYDAKKEVVFSFVSFENVTGAQIPIQVAGFAVKATVKEFEQYQAAVEKDRKANVGSSSMAGGSVVVSGSIRAVTDGKPARRRQLNNPIEKK
ncbi:MAG: GLPGLI family protein [Bacteroidota bacterium]